MPVRPVLLRVAEDQIGAGLLGPGDHLLVDVRLHPVVTVGKADEVPLCQVQRKVSGTALAAVFHREHPDPLRLTSPVFLQDPAGAVPGAVVDQDDLAVPNVLGQEGVQACVQILFRVVNRDDDAELHASASFPRV